jgi:glycosyltransferase involved in cell wall biosynthesis
MRIVYLLTSLGIGGAERQALAIAERMRERGHAVAVFTLRPRMEKEWPTTLPVFRLGISRNPFSVLAGLRRARRYLRDLRPSLIHSHGFHANVAARLLRLFVPSISVISTIHNVNEGGSLRMFCYRLTDPLARRTTAVSRAVADRFIALHAVPARKCAVMLNAVDLADLTPDPSRRAQTRAALAAGADFVWLAAGRLAPAKDHPNLLRAFAALFKTFPHAQLWVAGEGTAIACDRLQRIAVRLGIADAVHWLGLRRDLPALLDAADGFVLSSAWEGMPLALAEAMAMEKPAVATDVGGVRELLGEAGTLAPPQDAAQLAEAMAAVTRLPVESRAAQGRAARWRIQRHFSLDARAGAWESLYWDVFRGKA